MWNCRILEKTSRLSWSGSTAPSEAGSINITGDGRPEPTTTHSPIRFLHWKRALSSIDLIEDRLVLKHHKRGWSEGYVLGIAAQAVFRLDPIIIAPAEDVTILTDDLEKVARVEVAVFAPERWMWAV